MSKKVTYEVGLEIGGNVQGSLDKSVASVNKKLDSISNAAKTAAKVATAAFAAVNVGSFVKDAVSVYTEFNQEMANTEAIAGANAAEHERLEAAAREMGKKTTKTATEASQALGYMALAGWDVNTSIQALEPVLRLSEATNMDLATCSDLVTDSMSALGLTVDELSGYLDVACKANNKSNQSAQQLMEAYIGCGGSLNNLNVDVRDSATALGVLANRGIKGSEAGNKLNTVLINLTSGTGQAGKMMEKLNISAFDTEGKFIGLKETLELVNQVTRDLTEEERNAALAAIGGKTQIDTLNDLLAGLNTTTADGVIEWEALNQELYHSEGAMMNMANQVTDTLSGSFLRLESAVDDAKISLADTFADELKDNINGLSEYIPVLTQRFMDFSKKAGPKISRIFKSVTKTAGQAWNVFSGMGEWIIDNFDTVETMLAGIGGALIAYKVVSGLAGTAEAIKKVSTAVKALSITNPWLLGISLAISAIAGIAAVIKTTEKQAVKSNLAEHFGSIALSMDEISAAAEHILKSDNLSKVHKSMMAFKELDGIQRSMQDSIDTINKLNWKVSIGMELSADEQESYKAEIAEYVSQAQNYVQQQQYALNLNLSAFAEGDLERQNIVNQLNDFYSDKYAELEELGTKLNETVTAAFEDGLLDMDEVKEITEIQAQMARIQEAIATSDFNAKLEVMELQYSGANLDAESFQALQQELAEQVEAASAEYQESLTLRIANYQVMLEDGAINQSQYDAAVSEFWEDYLTGMSELEAKSLNFQTETIMQAYSKELGPAIDGYMQNIQSTMDSFAENGLGDWENRPVVLWDGMLQELEQSGLDKTTRKAIGTLLESMQPSIEQMEELKRKYEELGVELPQTLADSLKDVKTLNAMTKDGESIYYVLGQQMADSSFYTEMINTLTEKGGYVPEAVAEGIKANTQTVISPAVEEVYTCANEELQARFDSPFDVTAEVNIKTKANFSEESMPVEVQTAAKNAYRRTGSPKMQGHADGGIFGKPHVAWFAESGPEAVIPIDGSGNAVSLWEKTGQLLGILGSGSGESITGELYNNITQSSVVNRNREFDQSDNSVKFVYAPQVTVQGNADTEKVHAGVSMGMADFKQMIEEEDWQRSRKSFAG